MSITPDYIVVFKDYRKEFFIADCVDDLMWTIAQYFGFDKPVLKLGISGCPDIEDKIEMYDAFAIDRDYEILQIYEVGRKVYEHTD